MIRTIINVKFNTELHTLQVYIACSILTFGLSNLYSLYLDY